MYISVSDLKNYAYCPYIVFIKKVLNIGDIVTEYMLYGKEIEKDRILLSIYRYVKGVKILRSVMLISKRFSITGCVDYIIIDKYRQYIPVDIKWCEDDKPRIDHKVQICAYAFMIEENFNTLCKFGILYYVNRSGGRLAARTRGELVHGGSSAASLPLRVLAASPPPLGKE